MKRRSEHFLSAALLCLLLLLSCAENALAASGSKLTGLWLSPSPEKGTAAMDWYKNDKVYYLFIPGALNTEDLYVGLEGAEEIAVDGKAVRAGDRAACFTVGDHTVACGGKSYTVRVMRGSAGFPALFITTESGKLTKIHKSKNNKEAGTLVFINGQGETEYDGALKSIKMRGNSSLTFKKKNYNLKLETGADLCGMGKSKNWCLTGNYRDKSLLRNQITLDMAMYAGLPCTPEHITAEVYINNEYLGAYMFSEKVMIDGARIDIADLEEETEALNGGDLSVFKRTGASSPQLGKYKAYKIPEDPEDITGGYLIEFESYNTRYSQEASVYYTKRKNTLVVKSPEYCSEAQMAYISSFMQSFENAIFSKDGTDPGTGKHYTELMDMDSLVRKYLIEEVSKNYDGNSSSMFFYKPADSQSPIAFAGPVWDYDSAYASYAREDNAKKILTGKGFYINAASGAAYWWPALYRQEDFKQEVLAVYDSVFAPAMEILLGIRKDESGLMMSLEEYAESIRASADMNFVRWPIPSNPSTAAKTGNTFDKNITYLKDFIRVRYDFLNKEWSYTRQGD